MNLVLLDISATTEGRANDGRLNWKKEIAKVVSIPFTVGGGIKGMDDIARVLDAGADKVGINSAAVENPTLIEEAAEAFGSEKIVAAVDAKLFPDGTWHVMTHGGWKDAGIDALNGLKELRRLGAGEILLTSVDRDGVKDGYDLDVNESDR